MSSSTWNYKAEGSDLEYKGYFCKLDVLNCCFFYLFYFCFFQHLKKNG